MTLHIHCHSLHLPERWCRQARYLKSNESVHFLSRSFPQLVTVSLVAHQVYILFIYLFVYLFTNLYIFNTIFIYFLPGEASLLLLLAVLQQHLLVYS